MKTIISIIVIMFAVGCSDETYRSLELDKRDAEIFKLEEANSNLKSLSDALITQSVYREMNFKLKEEIKVLEEKDGTNKLLTLRLYGDLDEGEPSMPYEMENSIKVTIVNLQIEKLKAENALYEEKIKNAMAGVTKKFQEAIDNLQEKGGKKEDK